MTFLESYVLFQDPEMNRIFTQQIKSFDKTNIMGIDEYIRQEARSEALIEKELSVISKLLAQSNFSDEQIADIAGVSVTFVQDVRNNKK